HRRGRGESCGCSHPACRESRVGAEAGAKAVQFNGNVPRFQPLSGAPRIMQTPSSIHHRPEFTMSQDTHKQAVARAAIDYLRDRLRRDTVVGVGTGSTANYFIDYLAELRDDFGGAVASSQATAERLQHHRIDVHELNSVGTLDFYV